MVLSAELYVIENKTATKEKTQQNENVIFVLFSCLRPNHNFSKCKFKKSKTSMANQHSLLRRHKLRDKFYSSLNSSGGDNQLTNI